MEGIERCDFIALIVRDIRVAVRFYQDTLGLHLRFVDGDHYALFQVGAAKLALQVARPAGPDLPVADDLVAPTAERGVAISREPADYPWGDREFSVHDPDGHVLIFHGPSKGRA